MGFKRVKGNLAARVKLLMRRTENAKKQIPKSVGELAVRHFKSSFSKGGFAGGGSSWKKRKTSRYSHKVLNKTGALKNSLKVKSANFNRVVVIADIEYAQIHNQVDNKNDKTWNGGTIPQRKFMGSSAKLTKMVNNLISKKFKKVFR